MTCDDVVNAEIVEKYVLGALREETRDAFEQHYFDCGRCFELLQRYRALQLELDRTRESTVIEAPRKSWPWLWAWAPAMAVLLIAVSVGVWLRPPAEAPGSPLAPPSSGLIQPPEAPQPPAPSLPPPTPSFGELARVDPPAYVASRLRTADEATARFAEAMAQYQRRDWAAAISGLQAASTLDPGAAHIAFFLGVSHLLDGQPRLAIDELGRTIELGDSPYLEEAYFYLAKAHLHTRNIDAAITALERTIQLGGERAPEARQLLGAIKQVPRPSQ